MTIRPGRIQIDLSLSNGHLSLSVADDGVGMPDTPAPAEGLGMRIMSYRARMIGGTLEIKRNEPRGTRVTCVMPQEK